MKHFTAVTSGEVTITARGPVRDAAERVLGRLWIDQVPIRLASEDTTLWNPSGATEALCWPGVPDPTRALLPRIDELTRQAWADGLTDVVLLGSTVPTLAASMIVRNGPVAAADPPGGAQPMLTVLDTADPAPLFRIGADHDRLRRAIVVMTGDDPGTDALRRIFRQMFHGLGLSPAEIARRFVVIAEPGGLQAKHAEGDGLALVPSAPGPVFGALSPHALVAAALAGSDIHRLLDQASTVLPSLTRPENNPGLVLGAILGGTARAGRDVVVVGGYPSSQAGLSDWVAGLLTGASRGALLPLVQDGGVPVLPADDLFLITLDGRPRQDDATVSGPLGAQLVMWEYAAAVAAYLLGTDPLRPARTADRISPLLEPVAPAAPSPAHSPQGAAVEPPPGPVRSDLQADVFPPPAPPDGRYPASPPDTRYPPAEIVHQPAAAGYPPGDTAYPPPNAAYPVGNTAHPAPAENPGSAGPIPDVLVAPLGGSPQPPGAGHLGGGSLGVPQGVPPLGVAVEGGTGALATPGQAPPPLSTAHQTVAPPPAGSAPVFSEGPPQFGVDVHADDPALAARLSTASDLAAVFDVLADAVPLDGSMTILTYLDPDPVTGQRRDVQRLASILAARCGRPVTVTWRPCYPGFPNDRREKGVYLVLTGNVMQDVPVPDRGFRLGGLQLAQALGESRALDERGRPVVRLHLHNRWTGLSQLTTAAQGAT